MAQHACIQMCVSALPCILFLPHVHLGSNLAHAVYVGSYVFLDWHAL